MKQRKLTEFTVGDESDESDLLVYHDVLADDVADVYEALVLKDNSLIEFASRHGLSVGIIVETLTRAVNRLRTYRIDISRGYAFPGEFVQWGAQ